MDAFGASLVRMQTGRGVFRLPRMILPWCMQHRCQTTALHPHIQMGSNGCITHSLAADMLCAMHCQLRAANTP